MRPHARLLLALSLLTSFTVACDEGQGFEGEPGGDATRGGSPPPTSDGDAEGSPGDGDGDGDGEGEGNNELPDPGQLTAAEWRDLDHWDYWLSLVSDDVNPSSSEVEFGTLAFFATRWGLDARQRIALHVVSDEGAEVSDARATLVIDGLPVFEAVSDAHGRVELFADAFTARSGAQKIVVEKGAASTTIADPVTTGAGAALDVVLTSPPDGAHALDLMFVIDTTGSMGDELMYLQSEISDVVGRVSGHDDGTPIRLSFNFYRDDGDEYVIHSNPFTSDLAAAKATLAAESANGGGDWPEAVDVALADAVDHEWSENASSRLLFLVLDAPPHHDDARIESIKQSITVAAEKGIRIIPVASSGVDRELETFLRQMAVLTGGTYVFLTSDSGIGGEHLEPITGEVQVEFLNDLLARLIIDSLG
jgi:hypothetical protein